MTDVGGGYLARCARQCSDIPIIVSATGVSMACIPAKPRGKETHWYHVGLQS